MNYTTLMEGSEHQLHVGIIWIWEFFSSLPVNNIPRGECM